MEEQAYILKLFDTELIEFVLTKEKLTDTACRIISFNDEKKELLPIGTELTGESLLSWLRSRTIPKNRGYMDKILSVYGLHHGDMIGTLNLCYGLSLNDSYWIVPVSFGGSFDEYDLYDNEFDKPLSLIAYTGYGTIKARGFSSSPEFTTNGMLRKGWRRRQGKIYLYKGGTEGAANTGREPFSEYYASQIADAMGLCHVPYTLASWKKQVCSKCELFTDKYTSYVPICRFGDFHDLIEISSFIKSLGGDIHDSFADMLIFDCLIYNEDRHQGNFGLLLDSRTNKVLSFAPVFDNGMGLFPFAMDDDISDLDRYARTRVSAFNVSFDDIAAEFISDRQRAKLRKVLTFSFKRHERYTIPNSDNAQRLKYLEAFVRKRAATLLDMT